MKKRILALPLMLAIAFCACATSAFAEGTKKSETVTPIEVKDTSAKEVSKAKTRLKTDMDSLVNEARAGKIAPRPQQFPPTSRNNLSKTTKIAIAAAAIGAAITLIVVFHELSKD